MDAMYDFLPFVFSNATQNGLYVASLPLKTPSSMLLATHGRLFGIFSIRYPEIFPLDNIAKEILPYLEQFYYEQECFSVHSHLINSVTETQSYLEKRILEFNGVDSVDFSILVGCVWGSVLYTARCGGMNALRLYRDETFGNLFDINTTQGSSPVVSLSGYVQPHDVVVLYDSSISVEHFPLTVRSLHTVPGPTQYSKLTQMFDFVSQEGGKGSVSGFYLTSEMVPSYDEERVVFAEVEEERDLFKPIQAAESLETQPEATNDLSAEVEVEQKPSNVFNQLASTPGSMHSFTSRLVSRFQFSHGGAYSSLKKILAFFTRSRVFIIGCMFLLLFIGLILAGRDYEQVFKDEKKTDELKAELLPKIEESFKQGQYYAELNPERAKSYLKDAREYLAQFGADAASDSDIARLLQSVDDTYAVVTKTYTLKNLSPYFDLTTVNQQAIGSKIALASPSILVSDSMQSAVYKIGTESRSGVAVIGQSDAEGLISAEGDGPIVYAVSRRGIVRTQKDDSQVVSLMGVGPEWGSVVDMQVFASSVYLLDQSRNQVWKYIPEGNGFGAVRNYISSDESVSLMDATSLAIDGNVWVGLAKGEVIKFYSGKRDNFDLASLEIPIAHLQGIYTDELMDYLYVLDDITGRVIVFLKKDGSYVSTYESEQFKGAGDVVVDVENAQLYVINKQSLYRTEIRESLEKKE
jgi:hypothetical protein